MLFSQIIKRERKERERSEHIEYLNTEFVKQWLNWPGVIKVLLQ